MKKSQKNILEISVVVLLAIVIALIAFFAMPLGRFVSIVIFVLGFVPI